MAAVVPAGNALNGDSSLDLEGKLVFSTLIDVHTHFDKSFAIPRVQPNGTIEGALQGTNADRANWSEGDIYRRASFALRCAYVHGVSAVRSHIDSYWPGFETSWRVLSRLRHEWAGRVGIQLVAMIPLHQYGTEAGRRVADIAARHEGLLGAVSNDVDHRDAKVAEITDRSLDEMLRLAGERELDVDLHVDQNDNIHAFSLPRVAKAVLRARGFKGRALCSHCVNLALQPEQIARETIGLCREANLAISTMPMSMTYLQDRAPGRTPRWRGVTLVQELFDAGVSVSIGGDNCRDSWYPYGDHDMIDTFRHSVRVAQLDDRLNDALHMVGPGPAAAMKMDGVGTIAVGKPANLILFQARNLNEFLCRPNAGRVVLHRGSVVTEKLPDYTELDSKQD